VRVPGGKAATRLRQWLLGKAVRHAIILGYHRVSDGPDPYEMSVRPERFREQLGVLARTARLTPLEELPGMLAAGRLAKRTVVVTFDDGYADVLHLARPLLAQFGIPATVFVVSGALGRELWWDRLDRVATTARDLGRPFILSVGHSSFVWPGQVAKGATEALRQALYPVLRSLDQSARDEVLDQLSATLEVLPGGDTADLRRVVTPAELRCLGNGDLVRIGAHTVTHPQLSLLKATRQREEIAGSRRDLEALLERPVTGFSYPFGDMGPETPAIVREAGFTCACQSRNAVAWRGSDRFALPRFWVPNWDGQRFARWLERWLDD
jgi:peptidoglycan/xylan/chitin deacetylase (PgdA/CDA1 family)